MATNEAFSRVKIGAQLRDQGWAVDDVNSVRFWDRQLEEHSRPTNPRPLSASHVVRQVERVWPMRCPTDLLDFVLSIHCRATAVNWCVAC